jgi:hypothetical protein
MAKLSEDIDARSRNRIARRIISTIVICADSVFRRNGSTRCGLRQSPVLSGAQPVSARAGTFVMTFDRPYIDYAQSQDD